MNKIEINGISKRFNNKIALDNLSLTIEDGIIFGLLGPNGAGKTTLINCLITLVSPDKGEILIDGDIVSENNLKLKSLIGFVPQEIALFENLNAYENLEYFGYLYGLRGKALKTKIKETIELIGLTDNAKKKVKHYSGGMKRRLNIAAAMLHDPKILVLDEPTVGIDPQSRNHILEFIKNLNKEKKTTIIYTSHYMEEVEYLCDYVTILDLGKEIISGTKEQIKHMVMDEMVIEISATDKLNDLGLILKNKENIRGVEINNNYLKIVANNKINLNSIITIIQENKINLKNINIKEPSLEEVFLTLTGKQLRDGEE